MIGELPARLVDRLDIGLCWLWTGTINSRGYGQISWHGQQVQVHRLVRHLLVGDIEPRPTNLRTDSVDHRCRVRNCVNPDHLEPVTARENVRRGNTITGANARKTHCPQGHPYDKVVRRGRACSICLREATRRWRERKQDQSSSTKRETP